MQQNQKRKLIVSSTSFAENLVLMRELGETCSREGIEIVVCDCRKAPLESYLDLSEQGHDVTIFDLSPSPFLGLKQKMMVGNILDKEAVKRACKDAEVVFNFAGLADINEAKDKPEETITLNVIGNLNVFDAAKEAGTKRFVFASL